jgi:hypothetical protein
VNKESHNPNQGDEMKPGDMVKIVPEWCDRPEEANALYELIEHNEDRSLIRSTDDTFRIKPTQRVKNSMIEAA